MEKPNGESRGNIILNELVSYSWVEKYKIPYIIKTLERKTITEKSQKKLEEKQEEISKEVEKEYQEKFVASDSEHKISLPTMGGVTDEARVDEPLNDVLEDLTPYKPGNMDSSSARKVENITSTVLTAVTSVGIVASVLILAMIGIKYMLGSVEEKAEYKKDLIPYVVGAFVVFGITTFIKIFMLIGKQITNI